MDSITKPIVTSFILRFVQDQPPDTNTQRYRGAIRHIQTDREVQFTHWEDAENFIRNFISIDQIQSNTKSNIQQGDHDAA